MRNTEVAYKDVFLIPLAAYDEGQYAAMLIVKERNGVQRASGVLGHFPCAGTARSFALDYGRAEIDHREPMAPAMHDQAQGGSVMRHAA